MGRKASPWINAGNALSLNAAAGAMAVTLLSVSVLAAHPQKALISAKG